MGSFMKKVSCKKYYEFFDDNIYRNNNVVQSVFTTKHTYKEEWHEKNGGRKLLCMRTEECWEDENGYHVHKEYFIAE